MMSQRWALSSIFILLLLVEEFYCLASRRLQEELSHQDSHYDDILGAAIEDQMNNYQPAQQSLQTRVTRSLDGLYDFCLDESQLGFSQKWHSADLQSKCTTNTDGNNFYRMPVPSAFNEITSNKTVRTHIGWLWYQTTVDSHQQLTVKGGHKYAQFESVNYLAIVWVQRLSTGNSGGQREEAKFVGSHVGGYLPFIVNLTDALQPGDGSSFRLTIAVSNNLTSETIPSGSLLDLSEQVGRPFHQFKPDFDFFHFAGILGSVNLLHLSRIHVSEVRQARVQFDQNCDAHSNHIAPHRPCEHLAEFKIYTNRNSPGTLTDKNIKCSPSTDRLRYRLELWLKHEQLLASAEVTRECCESVSLTVPFNDSLIWEPANGRLDYYAPKLRVKVTLTGVANEKNLKSKDVYDVYELSVGFRAEHGDRSYEQGGYQLQGFGMHQEQLFSGRTMSQSAIMKDIYLLKQWGANLIRTSHYPYSREFLDACHENGILVIAECSAVGLRSFSERKLRLHKQLLKEMMQRDHNNPAIIGWSVANEPQSQLKEALPYFDELLEFCRNELHDFISVRFLTAAIAQSHEDDKIGGLLDVIMVNRYYGWYDWTGVLEAIERPLVDSLRGWSKLHPHKRLLLSEFGADTLAGMHSLSDELFSEEFQTNLVAEYERVFDKLFDQTNRTDEGQPIKFIGSMVWNFADFSTDVSLLRVGGNKKGVFTRDRRPKMAAHELKKIYLARLERR